MRIVLGNSETPSSIVTFALEGSQKRDKRGAENLFEEIIAGNFFNLGKKNRYSDPEDTEIPKNKSA